MCVEPVGIALPTVQRWQYTYIRWVHYPDSPCTLSFVKSWTCDLEANKPAEYQCVWSQWGSLCLLCNVGNIHISGQYVESPCTLSFVKSWTCDLVVNRPAEYGNCGASGGQFSYYAMLAIYIHQVSSLPRQLMYFEALSRVEPMIE